MVIMLTPNASGDASSSPSPLASTFPAGPASLPGIDAPVLSPTTLPAPSSARPGRGPSSELLCSDRHCCRLSNWAGESGPCERYELWLEQFEEAA